MKVIVTGAAGHLGAAVVEHFSPGHEVVALDRGALDLTNREAVRAAVGAARPDAVVNCAAYNDVDGAQTAPVEALELNAMAVLTLSDAASACGARLVHFSSDFVFDGEASEPYGEDDAPNPRSFYGCSKLLGEWLVDPRHYVFRVESLFGGPTAGVTAREGSLGRIVRGLRDGAEVPVFTDRRVSPAYAPDVARAVRAALERRIAPGVYHCVNEGSASWDEIAREAAARLGVAPRLRAITLDGAALAAPRPRYSVLSVEKLRRAGIAMPSWRDALAAWLGGPPVSAPA